MTKRKAYLQQPLIVGLLACFCCFLWGSAFPAIKAGYSYFQVGANDFFSQILFAGCRFLLAGILTILMGSMLRGHLLVPQKTSFGMIGKLSLIQTVMQYVFFYIGVAHTTGMKGAIINGSNTFITILLVCLVFRYEKMTTQKLIGCVVGFAGVIVVNITPAGMTGGVSVYGEGFLLIAATSNALSSILIKKYSKFEDPVVLSGYQFMSGGIIMIILGLILGGRLWPVDIRAYFILGYLACLSAVAYTLWGILLTYNSVGKVSIYGLTNPIFGAILSAVILKESGQMSLLQTGAALVLVCAGIYLVNRIPN